MIFALRSLVFDFFMGSIEIMSSEKVLPLRVSLSCSSLKLSGVKNCPALCDKHRDKAISRDVPAVLLDLMNRNLSGLLAYISGCSVRWLGFLRSLHRLGVWSSWPLRGGLCLAGFFWIDARVFSGIEPLLCPPTLLCTPRAGESWQEQFGQSGNGSHQLVVIWCGNLLLNAAQ